MDSLSLQAMLHFLNGTNFKSYLEGEQTRAFEAGYALGYEIGEKEFSSFQDRGKNNTLLYKDASSYVKGNPIVMSIDVGYFGYILDCLAAGTEPGDYREFMKLTEIKPTEQ